MKPNRKRIIVIVISIMFLTLFIFANKLAALVSCKVVSVNVADEDRLEQLIAQKERSAECPKLYFNGSKVAYDKESNTAYVPQNISGKNFEGVLKTAEQRWEIFFKEDEYLENKELAVGEGHAFTLYFVNDRKYDTCQLVFTGMPVMNILTAKDKEAEINDLGRAVNSGTVWVYDPYHSSTQLQISDCTYNIRGGTSENYEKSNYKLELTNQKLSFLGMREDDDWILNSLYDDAGLIHNKISFQVWREIAGYNDVKNDDGVTGEYLELFIDNEYKGVYLLTERVDSKTLSLGKNDILYKCRSARIPEEYNYTNENTDDMRPIFLLKYPKEEEEAYWVPLKSWVDSFCKLQMSNYEEGRELLNMENAIDYNLFTLLICGTDNMRKNAYLIAEYQKDGSYQFKKVPWDMNASWGNPWVDEEECNYTIYTPAYIEDVETWYTDVSSLYYYNEQEISLQLKNRWQEYRSSGLVTKEKLNTMVDTQLGYLHNSGAYKRNYERWPHGSEYWSDQYIYEYIDGRIDFLDQYFEKLYNESITPAVYDGVDYSDEFEVRFYYERYRASLAELYPYDRQQLLEHYVYFGKPFELHGRRNDTYPDDWEYLYGSKSSGSEDDW